MTRKLTETLGLESLEDALAAASDEIDEALVEEEEEIDPALQPKTAIAHRDDFMDRLDVGEQDHGTAADEIHSELVKQAVAVFDLAFQVEPNKAARMFEVGGNLMKAALDAKNSKRDAELKALKLMLDHRRANLDAKKARAEGVSEAAPGEIEAEAVVFADRNELLRRLKDKQDGE